MNSLCFMWKDKEISPTGFFHLLDFLDIRGSFEEVPAKLLNFLKLLESDIQNIQQIMCSSSFLCTG